MALEKTEELVVNPTIIFQPEPHKQMDDRKKPKTTPLIFKRQSRTQIIRFP